MTEALKLYGRGVRLPLVGDLGWRWVEAEEAVEQALRAILLTEPGERFGRPGFGVGLRAFLFAQNSVATRSAIREAIREAVERLEHRISLDEVLVETDALVPSLLHIDLRYRLRDRPGPRNLVVGFDLAQGVRGGGVSP